MTDRADSGAELAIERFATAVRNYESGRIAENNSNTAAAAVGDTNADVLSYMNCVLHVRTPPRAQELEYLELHAANTAKFENNALLDTLDFNVFGLDQRSADITIAAYEIFRRHNFTQSLGISQRALMRFLCTVRLNYFDGVPYHSFRHALNVLQGMHVMLVRDDGAVADLLGLTATHKFAALVACIGHDLQHAGVNNSFLSDTNSPIALRYNDVAILEQHHCAMTFACAAAASAHTGGGDEQLNIFAPFQVAAGGSKSVADSLKKFKELRTLITKMILSTEVAQHHTYVKAISGIADEIEATQQQQQKQSAKEYFEQHPDKRLTVMCGLLEACDIGNEIRPFDIAVRWGPLVLLEFSLQGARMQQLGLPTPAMMDRNKMNISKDQVGFLRFLCLPLYRAMARALPVPALLHCVTAVEGSIARWEALRAEMGNDDAKVHARTLELMDAAAASMMTVESAKEDRRRQRE